MVGSGPNGLAAAAVCARAGLSVQVLEAQPTLGGGARTLPDPDFPDVRHDICSAVHPMALGSPLFAEFDLAARGVNLAVPEISYANPFVERPAAKIVDARPRLDGDDPLEHALHGALPGEERHPGRLLRGADRKGEGERRFAARDLPERGADPL